MMANTRFRKYCYDACGFNADFNAVCSRIRRTYGPCPSPCDGPCYLVRDLKAANSMPKFENAWRRGGQQPSTIF